MDIMGLVIYFLASRSDRGLGRRAGPGLFDPATGDLMTRWADFVTS